MDRAFKIIGALSVSISAGALLGISTPTAMKAPPEADWRLAARSFNGGAPMKLTQPAVIYSSLPEDLSPQIGYGSPDAYQSLYVNAPVRTGYTAVPDYAAKPRDPDPAEIAADAAALAAHDVKVRAAASSEPANLGSSKTIDMPTVAVVQEAAIDSGVEAPAADPSGTD